MESIILYNDPGNLGRYSFASSTQILVQEMKYKIDQYLFGVVELVNVEEAIDNNASRNDESDDTLIDDVEIIPPFTINYEGDKEVSTLNNVLKGNITIPDPRTTIEILKIIEISMIQFGLTNVGDINDSSLKLFKSEPGNTLLAGRWNVEKLEFGINGFATSSIAGNTNTPITISAPGIYKFELLINSDSVGSVFSEISVKTQ